MKRALAGKAVWITGLRAEHSPNRSDMTVLEWDAVNQIIKYNPLLHWTTEEVRNTLTSTTCPTTLCTTKALVSIGCAPCTRAVGPAKIFVPAGWWWEDAGKKECGLHVHAAATN